MGAKHTNTEEEVNLKISGSLPLFTFKIVVYLPLFFLEISGSPP